MKRVLLLSLLLTSTLALADQINFNFTVGGPSSISASAAGLSAGPSDLTSISNSTTSVIVPMTGTFVDAITGPATSFVISTLIVATFNGAGPGSVLVTGPGGVLVSGSMLDGASLLSTFPAGSGSFLGTFDVSFVSPAALALFGLGPGFDPVGSVAFTFAGANVSGGVLTGNLGGGAVTIQTPPQPVAEVSTLLLTAGGLLLMGWVGRLRMVS